MTVLLKQGIAIFCVSSLLLTGCVNDSLRSPKSSGLRGDQGTVVTKKGADNDINTISTSKVGEIQQEADRIINDLKEIEAMLDIAIVEIEAAYKKRDAAQLQKEFADFLEDEIGNFVENQATDSFIESAAKKMFERKSIIIKGSNVVSLVVDVSLLAAKVWAKSIIIDQKYREGIALAEINRDLITKVFPMVLRGKAVLIENQIALEELVILQKESRRIMLEIDKEMSRIKEESQRILPADGLK